MAKGIVMDLDQGSMIVMTSDGDFVQLPLKDRKLDIGDEVSFDARENKMDMHGVRRWAIAAVLFIAVLFGGGGYALYYTPAGYVTIDINPSVDITYNQFDRTIGVRALNTDGENLLGYLQDVEHQTVGHVVQQVVQEARDQDYIRPFSEATVVVTVSTSEMDQVLLDDLTTQTQQAVEDMGVSVDVQEASVDDHKQAQEESVSVGRIILESKLRDLGATEAVSPQELKEKSVGDLMKALKRKGKWQEDPSEEDDPDLDQEDEDLNEENQDDIEDSTGKNLGKDQEKDLEKLEDQKDKQEDRLEKEMDKEAEKEEKESEKQEEKQIKQEEKEQDQEDRQEDREDHKLDQEEKKEDKKEEKQEDKQDHKAPGQVDKPADKSEQDQDKLEDKGQGQLEKENRKEDKKEKKND